MPVFICAACNETLKRAKVAAHAATCRGCWVLSCMDCNRNFEGDDYWDHTTCVTEAERYQGDLYVAKEQKGAVKQQAWLERVQAKLAANPSSAHLKPYLTRLLEYDNVPRKRSKFVNFAKNSLNLKADRAGIAEQLWDVVGAAEQEAALEAPPTTPAAANGGGNARGSLMPSPPSGLATAGPPSADALVCPPCSSNGVSTAEKAAAAKAAAAEAAEAAEAKAARKAARKAEKAAAKEAAKEAAAKEAAKAEAKAAKAARKAEEAEAEAAEAAAAEAARGARKAARAAEQRAKAEAEAAAAAAAAPSAGEGGAARKPKRGGGEAGGGGKRRKGEAPAVIDTLTKPIKWKKIIAKELQDVGGRMNLKELRKVAVAEARAHPSHAGRKSRELKEEFDRLMPTFDKFVMEGNQVTARQ